MTGAPAGSQAWVWALGIGFGLGVAALVYGLAWTSASASGVNATAGPVERVWAPEGDELDRRLRWQANVTLPADPEAFDVEVRLPVHVQPVPSGAHGARVHLILEVEGRRAFEHELHPGPGRVQLTLPGGQLDERVLEQGRNRIQATVDLERSEHAEGSSRVRLGPLVVQATPIDADQDGLLDAGQPLLEVPTYVLAAAGGVPAGVLVGWGIGQLADGPRSGGRTG